LISILIWFKRLLIFVERACGREPLDAGKVFADFGRSERRFGAYRAGPIAQRIRRLRIFAL
jgi:hypothetical protein